MGQVVAGPGLGEAHGSAVDPDSMISDAEGGGRGCDQQAVLTWAIRIFWAAAFIAGGVLFARRVFPLLIDGMVSLAEPIALDRPQDVLAVFFVFLNYAALPLPGKHSWHMVMAYAYGWWCLPFIIVAHAVGGALGFVAGRRLRRFLLDKPLPACCRCDGPLWRKTLLYIRGMRAPIEQRPFRMILLCHLAPGPAHLEACLIGAYIDGVTVLDFALPWAVGSIKYAKDVYLGTKAEDLAAYVQGENLKDGVSVAFTIASTVLAMVLGGYLAWRAKQEVERITASLSDDEEGPGGEQLPRLVQNDEGARSVLVPGGVGYSCGRELLGLGIAGVRCGVRGIPPCQSCKRLYVALVRGPPEPVRVFACHVVLNFGVVVVGLLLVVVLLVEGRLDSPLLQPLALGLESANFVGTVQGSGGRQRIEVPLVVANPNAADLVVDRTSGPVWSSSMERLGNVVIEGQVVLGRTWTAVLAAADLGAGGAAAGRVVLSPALQGSLDIRIPGSRYHFTYAASWSMLAERPANGAGPRSLPLRCAGTPEELLRAGLGGGAPCSEYAAELATRLQPARGWEWHRELWLTVMLSSALLMVAFGGCLGASVLAERWGQGPPHKFLLLEPDLSGPLNAPPGVWQQPDAPEGL